MILSFDIGIKNLAYCLLDGSGSGGFRIHDWNVIDLMTSPAEQARAATVAPLQCTRCGKPAKFRKHTTLYCGIHAKSSGWMLPKPAYTRPKLNARKKPELERLAAEHGIVVTPPASGSSTPSEGGRTQLLRYACTKAVYVDQLTKAFQERCLEPAHITEGGAAVAAGAGTIDLITLGRNMCAHLDRVLPLETLPLLTHVVLENQISTLASRMKTLQGELTMYFLIKCPHVHIEYVSSTHKLRHFAHLLPAPTVPATGTPASVPSTVSVASTENAKYRQHKRDAIRITQHLLETAATPDDKTKWTHVMTHKKRDDYADCLLQGLWYNAAIAVVGKAT